MKKLIATLIITLLAACPWTSFGQASIKDDPAYLPIDEALDLKANPPEFNVNLPKFLLNDTLKGLSDSNVLKEAGIDLGDILKDVKLIRVVVIEAKKDNRQALEAGVKKLQKQLEDNWTPVVQVPDGNVTIYALGDAKGESAAGLALLISDDGDIIVANVVGHVPLAQLINIATKKGALGALNGAITSVMNGAEMEEPQHTAKKPKSKGASSTNQAPATTPPPTNSAQ